MVFFNWATMQMAAKIVYYGPGLCGKTSNLSYIYAKTSPNSRGEMVSLETESDRTLFFDLLPIEVGTIGGFKTRLQLYTVPGQVFYNTTRKLVLKGVDGLVFVADSQRPMRDANLESFSTLIENLEEFGLEMSDLPIVLQYNKRDLKNVLSIDELNADLNPDGDFPYFEASAVNGEGVITTLKEITKITLKKLRARMSAPEPSKKKGKIGGPTVRPVKPPQPAPSISAASLARAAEEGAGDRQLVETPEIEVEMPPPEPPPPPPQPQVMAEGSAAAEILVDSPPQATPAAVAQTIEEPAAPEFFEPPPPPREEPMPVVPGVTDLPTFESSGPDFGEMVADLGSSDESAVGVDEVDAASEVEIEFDDSDTPKEEPPPVKRVHVTDPMDILAELDGLRKQATMQNGNLRAATSASDLDIDSLMAASKPEQTRELSRSIEKALNSDIFKNMRGMQLAIRIQNESGETIHTFDPVSLDVEDARSLKQLRLRFALDLENIR